jgi:hypothetical protein
MRRALSILLGTFLFGQVLVGAASAAGPGPFRGTWTSIDSDGSTQLLIVSSGATPAVTFQDFYASACDRFGGPSTHWVSNGQGTVDGDLLIVAFHKSGCGSFSIGAYEGFWLYQAGTDTLIDPDDIVWTRLR